MGERIGTTVEMLMLQQWPFQRHTEYHELTLTVSRPTRYRFEKARTCTSYQLFRKINGLLLRITLTPEGSPLRFRHHSGSKTALHFDRHVLCFVG